MSRRATSKKVAAFRRTVWSYYRKHGRVLPWRQTKGPYKILVSEVMLQQTQVERVIPFYRKFLQEFPTVRSLAKARLADVLKVWSGLGYNRRAKYLRDAAADIVEKHGGKVPREYSALRALSGVGDYTAKAVRTFAWKEPDVLIETNIQTALIHHFFPPTHKVRYSIACVYAAEVAKGQDSRQWHWALMDYGAYLKRSGVRNNSRTAGYKKQSKFEGSLRQLRGTILRDLHAGKQPKNDSRSRRALKGLERDGLIVKQKGTWRIA